MNTSDGLLLKRLVLVGYRKNYTVPFQPGINIIYGDVDTGKSSILRLVYYLLGGKKIKLDEEIASSVKYAVLELAINGNTYCICRDIFDESKDIDVYSSPYPEMSKSFPEKYKSSVSKEEGKNKSLSSFLLEALELPSVRIKQAPTKDSSKTARLSFLDLFKFMYLDQDDVGSAKMLNIGNGVLETKNREVFKYIFNVLDSSTSEMEIDISSKTQEKSRLSAQYAAVDDFLSRTEFRASDDLSEEISNIDNIKDELGGRLREINKRLTSDSELYDGLKSALDTINLNIEQNLHEKNSAVQNVDRFSRLYNDYENDIEKIKASLSARAIVGREVEDKTSCPVCETVVNIQGVSEKFDMPDGTRLKSELTAIRRRSRDLRQLISENKSELNRVTATLDKLLWEKAKAREMIDEELKKSISPYLAERDAIVSELGQLEERREREQHTLRVRNSLESIADKICRLDRAIEKLKQTLAELKKESPSLDQVVENLGSDLKIFIKQVKLKNAFGIGIDQKTLFPKVRDIEYRNINSGGLRTIVSIGYLTAILSQKLRGDTNIPGLLMIDTVGKYLGKNPDESGADIDSSDEDVDGISDPEKYRNLFEALVNVAERFDESNKLCQMILVDNDLPRDVAYKNRGFEIAHYRSSGMNNLPVGLIDDWDSIPKN